MTSLPHNTSFPLRADGALPLKALAASSGFLVLLVLGFLLMEAWPALRRIGVMALLGGAGWHPLEGRFGLAPMLCSSLAIAGGGMLVAAPLGLGCAIFIEFSAPRWLRQPYRKLLGLLAGMPSVVYGLWGLTAIVPLIARIEPPGTSLLAAVLVLALMIVPTVGLSSAAALASVPPALLQGAAALGMARRAIVFGVAVPAARAGIAAGIVLGTARALGETMAVLMVAGNVVQMPGGWFDPVRSLTANIALEIAYAEGLHRAGLFAGGLLLTCLVLLLAWIGARHPDGGRYARDQ